MIAAIVAVALVVVLSVGIFLYYKKCFAKTESSDGGVQVPNTSTSVIGSASKLDDVFEEQYHPKSNALDLVMNGDINFQKAANNNDVIQEVTVEDEASEANSPDKHQDTQEGDHG